MTAPATPRIAHGARRRGRIVVNACAVPRWVERWCERSGRSLVARPVDAVAVASAAGDSVLIPGVEPPAASCPRVVAALRSLPDDASVLVDALDAAMHLDGRLVVLHGVPLSFGERSVGTDEALDRGRDLLEEARALVDGAGAGVAVEVGLVRAWPHELVGELLDADLLVLGGPRPGPTGRVGLVASSALRHAPCAVLLAPRPTFPGTHPEGLAMSSTPQLADAVVHALRAPSVHNTQPWRWRIDNAGGVVELYADRGRHLSATDPEGRDLLISCGAALDHLVVALTHAGLQTTIRRFPDPENSTHLATVTVSRTCDGERDDRADLFRAIHRRHTDRRRFSHRPVPPGLVQDLVAAAARAEVLLVPVQHARERFEAVLVDAADRQRWTPGYPGELQIWTRRYSGTRDGIPSSAIARPLTGLPGPSGLRRFPNAELAQPLPPVGHGLPDDAGVFLVLATTDDRAQDRLRAGEALSTVLLTATRAGLATTPLSQATEVAASRDRLRQVVGIPEQPQLVLRIGWPATHAAELPDTPRRDLASVLVGGRVPTAPRRS